MIYLDNPNRKMQIVLAGAVATNQLECTACYFDYMPQATTTVRRGGTAVTSSNDTTDSDIIAAPVLQGIVRNVHTVIIYNKDTAAATITIKIDESGTETILVKQTLASGESMMYEDQRGWHGVDVVSLPVSDTTELVKGSADTSKRIRFEVDGLTTGTTRVYTVPNFNGTLDAFAAGTKMLFQQTAAPSGWTKDATHNDKALRVVTGTASNGGATAFTTVFGSGKTTGSHTLTIDEIPSHTHSYTANATNSKGNDNVAQGGDDQGSTTGATGGGGGHTHTLSLDLHYVDVIIATKD